MAYDTNKLSLQPGGLRDGSWNSWVYRSTDSFTTVKAANYISDAQYKGVKAGDVIIIVEAASPPVVTESAILTVTATTCTMGQTGTVLSG